MEKKVIGLIVLMLVALGAYQGATGGIKQNIDLAQAKAYCADAMDRARAIRAGKPLPQSEGISSYRLILTDCRDKQYLASGEIGDLLD